MALDNPTWGEERIADEPARRYLGKLKVASSMGLSGLAIRSALPLNLNGSIADSQILGVSATTHRIDTSLPEVEKCLQRWSVDQSNP